ncbi:glycosyltransferase [Microbacterium sp.]|uniref:glycosyltransferase n=1 Tax=Microbacterium sp. TaxID=51671 RepID=UPI002BA7C71C|nr:glycosyltransferase [Microbacterium sp.]HWL77201.1 glycosyltransferase [Microbacterium sp.]
MNANTAERRAIVFSFSDIANDPRVRRQVDWLTGAGWVVDTVGTGTAPVPKVRDAFTLHPPSRVSVSKAGLLLMHLLTSRRRRFRTQISDRIPQEALTRFRSGHYNLVVLNETEFTPILSDSRDFTAEAKRAQVHVDLHEYHNPRMRRQTLGGRITAPYYRWVRNHIAHPDITSRSVVNDPIGRLYVDEFGLPPLTPVHNAPPHFGLVPTPVDSDAIRLVHHGLAARQRGIAEMLEAMRVLPERFTLTLMLTGNPALISELEDLIDVHPARDRIQLVPPVPMNEIVPRIHQFDLEVIFFPPIGTNLALALPNKLFEAVQAGLGVVVGESPAMMDIVRDHGFGIVAPGFGWSDLAASIADLTADDVARLKAAAHEAAPLLNAEVEGRAFLDAVEAGVRSRGGA